MSRGPGKLERALIEELSRDGHWRRSNLRSPLFATSYDLAYITCVPDPYPEKGWQPTRSQRQAASRAIRSLVRKYPERYKTIGGKGAGINGLLYVYDATDPASARWAAA